MRPELDLVERIRRFNRFYTNLLGLLNNKILKSNFSLVEARVLFQLGEMTDATASDLVKILNLDPGYLSRTLRSLEQAHCIEKTKSTRDTRKQLLRLSSKGRHALADLVTMSNKQIKTLIARIPEREQTRLVTAMNTIQQSLGDQPAAPTIFTFRDQRPGDIGTIINRHAVLYGDAYGFDETFELYVAKGLAQFMENRDPERERLWIVEADHEVVASVGLVQAEPQTAQLRWLLVEPRFRKQGLGKKIVEETIHFSREKEYRKIILWTVDILGPARHLYANAGFRVVDKNSHHIWGMDLTEECWEMEL